MDYNYHTHTYRCNHATGDDEEYVLRAIDGGVKYMGFSDHAPFIFNGGFESNYRIQMNEVRSYFESIQSLREKYRDKIDIKIGFEMECYPTYFDEMLEVARNVGAEYLILGQHYLGDERPAGHPSTLATDDRELLRSYVDCVVRGIESGAFSYVAHPDIVNFTGDDIIYREEMARICEASINNGTPLEINFLGIRDRRRYPNMKFWKIAGELHAPVTFGFDAHTPADAFDEESLKTAEKMVEKYALNYIGMPKIKPIK